MIERLRVEARLSVRKAAGLAGISEGRWRQIAKGYQAVTKDIVAPVVAPADTVKKMFDAVCDPTIRQIGEMREYRPDVADLFNTGRGLAGLIPVGPGPGAVFITASNPSPIARLKFLRDEMNQLIEQMERDDNAQVTEPQQSQGSTSSGTGAPNTRAAESAAYDPSQHAGVSGIAKEPPVAQDQFDLAASRTRKGYRTTQDERDKQDEWHPDPEGSEGGA